jgi:hypothetical protein
MNARGIEGFEMKLAIWGSGNDKILRGNWPEEWAGSGLNGRGNEQVFHEMVWNSQVNLALRNS